jgi:hypothetical protein
VADHEADPERQPLDEEAAWAAIVAAYGDEPADPPGVQPFTPTRDMARLEEEFDERRTASGEGQDKGDKFDSSAPKPPAPDDEAPASGDQAPTAPPSPPSALGGSVVFAPGVGGPRDYEVTEPGGSDDEGHFVPPEPPPLPTADVTSKFAWLGVVGGPVLMFLSVILQWDRTWWLTTLCAGGFVGGFITLVARMNDADDDDDEAGPGSGAVV